ncbi:hypothetical protein K469DRAFT_727048 [Zopfia rhizophila CBS 207.26]|uniref:Vacuolar ATPase assembly protein VMA22 n=1 Tax=Zopfia rhizophila CBS 207.26 TaxID=1314779 RepID=A0A6A6E4P3_9PEZI|nr:hypothetical protein K469DRAFT_727048 [Zopfia rhizophila CBS 207.26]
MAEVLPQAKKSPEVETADKDALTSKLDELLEQYLNTLDLYQKAQQQLTSSLSSGFLSLAQANFNNQSHSRYGQDYYDKRMQACRKAVITDEDSKVTFALSTLDSGPRQSEHEAPAHSPKEPSIISTTSGTPAVEGLEVNNASSGDSKTRSDPLRWFGILVPPALRTAQSSFVSAVEGPIPHLVFLMKELRKLEVDIGRLRKQLKKMQNAVFETTK